MIQLMDETGGGMPGTHLGRGGGVTVIPAIHSSTQKGNRPLCQCGNLCEIKHRRTDGLNKFRGVCASCRARRNGRKINSSGARKKLSASSRFRDCQICGWYGPCDMHRIIHGSTGGKYSYSNIAILCPNCHRKHHHGILEEELVPYATLFSK